MSALKTWSTAAAGNNAAPPDGFPENMAPSGVNDAAREMMAAVATWYRDAQWIDRNDTPTYVTANSFTISGDVTAHYHVGRRLRLSDSGTLYGFITASNYSSPNTTVAVHCDSGTLSGSLSAVALGLPSCSDFAMPATGPLLLETMVTAGSQTSVAFTKALYFSGLFRSLEVRMFEVVPSNDGIDWELYFRVGAADLTSGYQGSSYGNVNGGGVSAGTPTTARARLSNLTSVGNGAGEQINGVVRIFNPGLSGVNKRVMYEICYGNTSGALVDERGSYFNSSISPLDGLKMQPSSGYIYDDCVFELWGWR